jgi:hypothetical protein
MKNIDFSNLRNKKIAITGSRGFIAKNINEYSSVVKKFSNFPQKKKNNYYK